MTSRWKFAAHLLLGALVSFSAFGGDPASKTFSGRAKVDGLGEIVFPPGQWALEFQRTQLTTNIWRPDYFVFRKAGDPIHRLAILRYARRYSSNPLSHKLDGLHETMGECVPPQERKGDESYSIETLGDSLAHLPSDPQDISWSFISTRAEVSWLCHARLFRRNGQAFAVLYTSPQVAKPNLVDDVVNKAKFPSNHVAW